MSITHFALVEDYFDEGVRLRVFICTDCGALVGNDFIEAHESFHRRLVAAETKTRRAR